MATSGDQKPNPYQICRWFSGKSMDDYDLLNEIGRGTYGVVYRALDKKSGEIVAVKMEFDGLSLSSMREICILMSVPRDPSVVEVKQVIEDGGGRVFVVMEYAETDLDRLIGSAREPFPMGEVKEMMRQILEGVEFLHENGIMHRDLKPSNILVNRTGQLKICDFGLSREFRSRPGAGCCTSGVGSLWYQSPEILHGATQYSAAVDMWAVGCIMGELLTRKDLFQGKSEADQLRCIRHVLGTPNLLQLKLTSASCFSGAPVITGAGFDLLSRLLAYYPEERITAREALNHRWFREFDYEIPAYL